MHADVLSDPSSGRSKGCGLVEFETAKGAAAAVGQLNKVPLRGRPLQVRADRDDTSQSGAAYNGRLFLRNLSWQVRLSTMRIETSHVSIFWHESFTLYFRVVLASRSLTVENSKKKNQWKFAHVHRWNGFT